LSGALTIPTTNPDGISTICVGEHRICVAAYVDDIATCKSMDVKVVVAMEDGLELTVTVWVKR
jgi:hypothetical protein